MAGELDRQAVERNLRRASVEGDRAAPQLRRHLSAGAPNQRAQAGEHFLHPERLRRRSRRRRRRSPAPSRASCRARSAPAPGTEIPASRQRREQRQPVDLRQSEVEDDRVVAFGLPQEIPRARRRRRSPRRSRRRRARPPAASTGSFRLRRRAPAKSHPRENRDYGANGITTRHGATEIERANRFDGRRAAACAERVGSRNEHRVGACSFSRSDLLVAALQADPSNRLPFPFNLRFSVALWCIPFLRPLCSLRVAQLKLNAS